MILCLTAPSPAYTTKRNGMLKLKSAVEAETVVQRAKTPIRPAEAELEPSSAFSRHELSTQGLVNTSSFTAPGPFPSIYFKLASARGSALPVTESGISMFAATEGSERVGALDRQL